jgi:hypothetical protein
MFLGKLFFLIYNHALQFFSRINHLSNEKGVSYGKDDDEMLPHLKHLREDHGFQVLRPESQKSRAGRRFQ